MWLVWLVKKVGEYKNKFFLYSDFK